MGTRLAPLALAVAAFAVLLNAGRAVAAERTEPEVKAELIERFTRFVEWERLPDTMTICVVGDSPITPHLQKIARRQTIKDKHARVVSVVPESVVTCQVVLIAGDDTDRLRAVISRTMGRPILSIAEAPGASAAGAIINFYLDEQHIRFEINTSAAKRSGLTLRSKLLSLARIVRDEKAAP
jgi:hypothetical protein